MWKVTMPCFQHDTQQDSNNHWQLLAGQAKSHVQLAAVEWPAAMLTLLPVLMHLRPYHLSHDLHHLPPSVPPSAVTPTMPVAVGCHSRYQRPLHWRRQPEPSHWHWLDLAMGGQYNPNLILLRDAWVTESETYSMHSTAVETDSMMKRAA